MKIADYAMIACSLEVLSYKPGNVNRFSNNKNTKVEDFFLSIYGLYEFFLYFENKAYELKKNKIAYKDIELGKAIYQATKKITKLHKGGNTHLGIILLLFPLIFGYSIGKNPIKEIEKLLKNTTYKDSIYFYKAIKKATLPYKSTKEELDIFNPNFSEVIGKNKINLYKILEKSQKNDLVAKLLVNNYNLIYKKILPFFKKLYGSIKVIEKAIIVAYLYALSSYYDSHVVKKHGFSVAQNLKKEAIGVFERYMNSFDLVYLEKFDDKLKKKKINPGTCADIICATIFIFLIENKSDK